MKEKNEIQMNIYPYHMVVMYGMATGEEDRINQSKRIRLVIWELPRKEWNVEVKHVRAHRTKKENNAMTEKQKFVMEGNNKTDELVKEGVGADSGK